MLWAVRGPTNFVGGNTASVKGTFERATIQSSPFQFILHRIKHLTEAVVD